MKKEYPFSTRIDQEIAQGIEWAKKEYGWKNDSETGRNILALGIDYLQKAKEIKETPELASTINQKMADYISKLYTENETEKILPGLSDEELNIVFRGTYIEDQKRQLEKIRNENELKNARRKAEREQQEEERRKTERHIIVVKKDNGKMFRISCHLDANNKPADVNGNTVPPEIFDKEPMDLPEGIEYIGEVSPEECLMFD